MSRITYTKKGAPSVERTTKKGTSFERTYKTEGSKPINEASLSTRLLWAFGNLIGASQIKINAKKSRGYSISVGKTFTAFNFGKLVAYKRNTNPSRDVWYKRTMVRGEYQFTPPSFTNTTMQMIRIPAGRS